MINLDSKLMIELIEPYPIVTFDVFDTLIKRDVTSFKDIVKLMERDYFKITGKKLPFYFYRERVHAPKVVLKKRSVRDVSIDDIYSVLHIEDKDIIKEIEFNIELECATVNPEIFKVYEYCVKHKKKIYAISDMYLTNQQILLMIQKCGYYNIDKLYVSQEYDVSKASGELFAYFLEENHIKPETVIHIGDNLHADIYGARKVGMHAVHIPNRNDEPAYMSNNKFHYSLDVNILYKKINNGLLSIDDNLEKVGYEVLGPLLFYYTKWLHGQVTKNDIKKLYFLSRDGYLLMKSYELLYNQDVEEIYYLSISSKSVRNTYKEKNSQKELLIQYLKQNKMSGTIAIVDIGWSGRLHKKLKETAISFADIYGFYLGTFKLFHKNVRDGGVSQGFLKISRWKRAKVFMNAGFIEILFSDTFQGTTEEYMNKDGEVYPVLSLPNPNGEIIRKIQKGAIKFVDDWSKSVFSSLDYPPALLVNPVLKLSMSPRKEDVDIISEEYAGSGTVYYKLTDTCIDNPGLSAFLKRLRAVVWKGGFLERNCRIPLLRIIYKMINPILIYFKRDV